ncbi:TOBE domain-containing protein [Streptomyces tirandamycinicus]|uniref:TOBE domain-containing protein n=1 Tax=Streptomyces TaxID=1883 RepID=UPI000366837A|nr:MULTISPECIES: TOBE domain-containing protein [Streptomyces]MCY0980933.1 TOBE domain-containing protein [Streptomyces tirandamycinicus]NNJ03239.1 TOBE domain-containing protein [Streptomyces sp. PKU-MA01144]TFE48094.1 adenylate kinase [Streptomyces sp. ICN441]
MSLSIRNQLPGTVMAVSAGPAMAAVKIRLDSGDEITSAVTADAVTELGIFPGGAVSALVKASEVALAASRVEGLSIRNQLPGTVTSVTPGAAMATVRLRLDGGQDLTAVITKEALEELGLAAGSPAVALVKATEISLSTA